MMYFAEPEKIEQQIEVRSIRTEASTNLAFDSANTVRPSLRFEEGPTLSCRATM